MLLFFGIIQREGSGEGSYLSFWARKGEKRAF